MRCCMLFSRHSKRSGGEAHVIVQHGTRKMVIGMYGSREGGRSVIKFASLARIYPLIKGV